MTSNANSFSRRVRLKALLVLLLAVVAQQALWWNTRILFPRGDVLAAPPGVAEVDVLSLSDRQFFFRQRSMDLQVAGDLGGRVTPLTEYNYALLYRWWKLLDLVDSRSNYTVTLAGYFYSQTLNTEGVRYVIAYLREHTRLDPVRNWRWLAHAAWLARHKVKDTALALDVALELENLDVADIPIWTKQLRAFVLADIGDREAARDLIRAILGSDRNIPKEERFFMQRFLEERLQ